MSSVRQALVVRGGWDGHAPVECTERFLPFLREHNFEVSICEDLSVYADPGRLAATDLVVQCWSMGEITEKQAQGLAAAVRAGTGFAGWHGGIVASFDSEPYQQLTGGRFVYHPPGFVEHDLTVVPGRQHHPIVTGIETVPLHTEKYWVLTDALCDVLATVTFPPDQPGDDPDGETPWRREVVMPAVWTRQWGAGRVFVSTVGHRPADLAVPAVRQLTERGLLWAARE
ncbi:ThuA domain-containing protein [Natronosporangium hydrolyticum]|uniref:ThuA domain-containing protein n=1 Tax=Natronosporangium hydrolyticum TaxID=2811111 RepID=A0A895YGN5_9ACTN|nr:ThuA domain-containing protein [Natronosporangium hydrolyticum]QSB13340.1 ThuA domain-containing protein [Natronosporangium hydrolyticum]